MLKSADMANFNMQNFDLPKEDVQQDDNKSRGGGGRLVLWLVVVSMAFLVLPVFLVGGVIESERTLLQEQLDGLQAELNAPPVIDPEIERLEGELLQLRNDTSAMNTLATSLATTHIDWAVLMQTFISYDPNQMEVTNIEQSDRRIIISGRSDDETHLMYYVDVLQGSGLFAQVLLQSITRNPPEVDENGNTLPDYRLVDFVIQVDLENSVP